MKKILILILILNTFFLNSQNTNYLGLKDEVIKKYPVSFISYENILEKLINELNSKKIEKEELEKIISPTQQQLEQQEQVNREYLQIQFKIIIRNHLFEKFATTRKKLVEKFQVSTEPLLSESINNAIEEAKKNKGKLIGIIKLVDNATDEEIKGILNPIIEVQDPEDPNKKIERLNINAAINLNTYINLVQEWADILIEKTFKRYIDVEHLVGLSKINPSINNFYQRALPNVKKMELAAAENNILKLLKKTFYIDLSNDLNKAFLAGEENERKKLKHLLQQFNKLFELTSAEIEMLKESTGKSHLFEEKVEVKEIDPEVARKNLSLLSLELLSLNKRYEVVRP